jgi:hypothetical protein
MPETIRYDGLYEYAQQHGLDYNELCRVVCAALPSASLGEQREPKRPDSLPVILNMLRETKGGDECRVPTPACWDLARYITDLERLAASPASDGAGGGVCIDCNTPLQRFCSECKAGPLATSPDQQEQSRGGEQ